MPNHSIKIFSIYCYQPSEGDGDDVYLECQADGGFSLRILNQESDGSFAPKTMSAGTTWYLGPDLDGDGQGDGLVFNFDHDLQLIIWDQDVEGDPNTATFLINKDFTNQSSKTQSSYEMYNKTSGETVHYKITFQLLN